MGVAVGSGWVYACEQVRPPTVKQGTHAQAGPLTDTFRSSTTAKVSATTPLSARVMPHAQETSTAIPKAAPQSLMVVMRQPRSFRTGSCAGNLAVTVLWTYAQVLTSQAVGGRRALVQSVDHISSTDL